MLVSSCFFGSLANLCADDWPQWLGPRRDGTSAEKGLIKALPEKGPPKVWEKNVGEGFSGPVIVGDRLILLHRLGDKEVVESWEAATGKPGWKFDYGCTYVDNYNAGNGPRSTPAVAGKRVFTLGVEGWLHCLDLETGKKIWGRNIVEEYKVPENFFGVGTSPVVEGDLVLVNVGGKKAGIVAFHTGDGKEAWKATTDGASYSSPVAATIAGKRSAIFFTREGVVLLDPADGKVRHAQPWRSRERASVNAATPLVVGDLLFFSSSYETGALTLRVGKEGVKEVWSGDEIMSNHFATCVHHQGFLYGFDGRQEGTPSLRCVELATGKVKWTKEKYGCGSMVVAEGHAFMLLEEGDLVLLELSPEGYRERGRAAVLWNPPCRAQLALANGKLYGRDGKRLVCWNVQK
jgi:outer membrane protein assembly factor BamB